MLAETDVSLSEIGLQMRRTDRSHFSALFRAHVALTPETTETTPGGKGLVGTLPEGPLGTAYRQLEYPNRRDDAEPQHTGLSRFLNSL